MDGFCKMMFPFQLGDFSEVPAVHFLEGVSEKTCAPSMEKKDDDVLPEKMRPVEVLFVMPTTKVFMVFVSFQCPRFFHMKIMSLPWN